MQIDFMSFWRSPKLFHMDPVQVALKNNQETVLLVFYNHNQTF